MNTVTYTSCLTTFYLKGEISADTRGVKFQLPSTLLGVIPLGRKSLDIPMFQIISVSSRFHLSIGRVLFALVPYLVAIYTLKDYFVVSLIAALVLLSYVSRFISTRLEIQTAGDPIIIDFWIWERKKALEAQELIQKVITLKLNSNETAQ